jgi:hypothetical protein
MRNRKGCPARSQRGASAGIGIAPVTVRPRSYWIIPVVIGVCLTIYSQTLSAFYDESFHLLAAQLINQGKLPYVDFFYQHTPLYPYVLAYWMRAFASSWHSAHALSSTLTAASLWLVARYVFGLVPDDRWRFSAGSAATVLFGLDILVVRFSTIAQPYAWCLLLVVASFLVVTASTRRPQNHLPFLAGLFGGAAAASSLLTVPVAPIELLWLLRHTEGRRRWGQATRFAAGFVVGLAPIVWFIVRAPEATFFDTVQYHIFHRSSSGTRETAFHQLNVLSSMVGSIQALVLVVLSVAGFLLVNDLKGWDSPRRAEVQLCASIAAGLGLFLMIPYPTFAQYFILTVPFLSILGAVGIYGIGSRLWASAPAGWVSGAVCGVFVLGLATTIHRGPRIYYGRYWKGLDEIAVRVNSVTGSDGQLYSDDANVYFAARRTPLPGLENPFGAGLDVRPGVAARLHVVPQVTLDSLLAAGQFETVLICSIQDRIDSLGLTKLYLHREEFRRAECSLFWGRRDDQASSINKANETLAKPR